MPQGLLSDDYYADVRETFGLNMDPLFAEQIIDDAKSVPDSELWGMIRDGDYEAVIGHMYLADVPIPEDIFNQYLAQEFEDNEIEAPMEENYIPEDPFDSDRSFNTGAEFAGSLQIVETENDKVYVPSSYYCHTKVFNKFLDLQGRGDDIIPLEGKGINPYSMSKTGFLNHVLKYMIKCDCLAVNGEKRCKSECYINKRKLYEDKKTGNDYYRENSSTTPCDIDNPENFCKPSICRVWWGDGKVNVKPINKAAQSHPRMCIGLVSLKGTDMCHAVLIKDYRNLSRDDIIIHLSKNKVLFPGFKKFKNYTYRDPKPYAVAWDIETWVRTDKKICNKCVTINNGKISRSKKECACDYFYKLNVAAIGYEIINIVTREIIQPCKILFDFNIKEDDEITLFDMFFEQLQKECIGYGIKDVNLYAHNSGRFDNIFAKKSRVIKFDNEISNGNHIKSMKVCIGEGENKLKISFLDTLPFTLQPLKDACETFKTAINKEEFDIINKSRKWYCMNRDPSIHNRVINSIELQNEYIRDYMDMHMKCNYNIDIEYKGNGIFTCDPKYAEAGKNAKIKELEDIKTFKDWSKYLSFDVRSLSNLVFNVENMYNDFGFSITNYVGLPGIAMDMMNSYCYNLSKLYVPSDPSVVELCHASIYGGRTIHFKDSWDSPINDKGEYTDYLICLDMNSLYPSAMYACGFPVGKPELLSNIELLDGSWQTKAHYLGEFEITIPNIRYAIHPYRTEKGTVLYPSNQTIIGVYNDVDIREMIKDGYSVKIRKGIYWKKSSKIFSELTQMLYERRSYYKSLNPEDPEFAKEYICKICLNAQFGKFNETIRSLVRFFTGDEEEMKNTIDKRSRVSKMENGQYRISETLKVPKISKPTYIAGYVTAYSRAICNELFRKIGANLVYYSDTDSVYMKFSDFNAAKLVCGNGLCGFKNDYGDGVMITKARFLDIKRCYFEFRTKVDAKCLDKWGKPRLSCKDPITKVINEGDPYYVKTFKFKYTGINFRDIVTSSALEPDNKLYSKTTSVEEYNKIMFNTEKIVNKFIENNRKNVGKPTNQYEDVQFIMKRFKKNGHSVTINLSEFSFVVTPEKRGQWVDNKHGGRDFYSLGYDLKKEDETWKRNIEIGTLEKSFANYTKCNYGYMVEKDRKFLRSRRPIFYKIRMHIEQIKEKCSRNFKRIESTNELVKEFNNAPNRPEFVQKIFDEYLQYTEDVKNEKIPADKVRNGKYVGFLNGMMKIYITPEIKTRVDKLINTDVVYDSKKEFDTDYYIEFTDEIIENPKFDDYGKKYRIISKMISYSKGSKKIEYFIPNFINVKGRAENVNTDKLYPIIMLSTRFNKDLGRNNLENWQTMNLIKNFV